MIDSFGVPDAILRMDRILHHLRNHGKPSLLVFAGNHQKPGFLRWCKVGFVHSQYLLVGGPREAGAHRGGHPAAAQKAGDLRALLTPGPIGFLLVGFVLVS